MSRLTLSDEMHILNELSYMEERLYKGLTTEEDVKFSVKTIRNLMLEIYLMQQSLNSEEKSELEMHIKNTLFATNAAVKAFEANKPF